MKLEKQVKLLFIALTLIAFAWVALAPVVFASENCRQGHEQCGHNDEPGDNTELENEQAQSQGQEQSQGQSQGQDQSQEQTATANNSGNNQSVHYSYPRQVPNLYLNQSGNIVNCARIFGFGGANTKGSFMFGIPAGRQRDCDIWLAVNEAQENGHVALSYAFMCEIKHIKDVWGKDRCDELTRQAIEWLDMAMADPVGSLDPVREELLEVENEHEYDIQLVQATQAEVINRMDRLEELVQRAPARPQVQRVVEQKPAFTEEQISAAWQALKGSEGDE